MRGSRRLVQGLRILALALAVQGCAVQAPGTARESVPDRLGEAWRAPLVLRPGPVAVNMQAPTRAGHDPGLGGEVFWLSVTSLLTFGVPLLDLPNVVGRHRTTVMDLPKECADSWVQVMNRPQWLGPPEARTSALHVLADAMRSDLGQQGRRLTISIEPTSADDPLAGQALATVGTRLSAPALVVADVLFSIEPQAKACAMMMRVSARMHLEVLGDESKQQEAVSLAREGSLSVTQWAADPESGTRTLQDILGRLGRDIVRTLPP